MNGEKEMRNTRPVDDGISESSYGYRYAVSEDTERGVRRRWEDGKDVPSY